MATRKRSPKVQGRPPAAAPGVAREALLDAAQELFGTRGIAATSLSRIAGQAGVTPAMVHYYFSNRDQLLDALVEERIQPLLGFVWGPVMEGSRDPLSMLEGLIQRLLEGPGKQTWLPSLWVREVLSEGGQLRERILKQLPRAQFQALASALAAGQKKGTVNPELEPSLLVMSVMGLVMLPLATASLWRNLPGTEGLDASVIGRHALALLNQGLRPSSGG